MTSLFLFFVCTLALIVIIAVGFKPKRNHLILYTVCIFTLVVTLFFGLKPKGYRFLNQVQWLRQGNGIAFTNIGMIHSEKTLGAIGITDSIIIIAEVLPYSKKRFARFVTIINKNGDEIFYIDQRRMDLIVSLQENGNKPPVVTRLPNAVSTDTIRRVTMGIGSKTIWLESDNNKRVARRLPSELQPRFLENCTFLIGYDASGANPWNGELYRLTLYSGGFRHADHSGPAPASEKMDLLKKGYNAPIAEFLFAESTGHRIINERSNTWNLRLPLFPQMFKYNWPQPLTRILPLSKYSNHHTLFDPVVNLLGFIPFGVVFFLLFSMFHQKRSISFLYTFLIAVLTSTSIELLQVLIPTRVSEMIDIVLNITGACIGALSVPFLRWLITLIYSQKRS
jgi:VanZ family protein